MGDDIGRSDDSHPSGASAELLVDTRFTPLVLRSPAATYAASACAALATGFGALAAGLCLVKGSRSKFALANGTAATAFGVAAVLLHATAPTVRTIPGWNCDELPDRNLATALDYSIVVPVYNRAAHLRALLARLAVLADDWSELGIGEIIIVDDGSNDDTNAVASGLAALMPIPTRVLSKRNGGVASARNAGFSAARGTVVISIDSDCLPEKGWLPCLLRAVRSDPTLVAFARIRDHGRIAYPLANVPDCKGFVTASFAMERRRFLALGGCHERYIFSYEDRDLVLRALANGLHVGHARDAWICHPVRRETVRSMWTTGLKSIDGNLFAARHGPHAGIDTRPSPYYLLGLGSNYGSSIAAFVAFANLLFGVVSVAGCRTDTADHAKQFTCTWLVAAALYVGLLGALGLRVGARTRDLPEYVAVLAAFQLSTCLGRLRGTLEHGVFLL